MHCGGGWKYQNNLTGEGNVHATKKEDTFEETTRDANRSLGEALRAWRLDEKEKIMEPYQEKGEKFR